MMEYSRLGQVINDSSRVARWRCVDGEALLLLDGSTAVCTVYDRTHIVSATALTNRKKRDT